MPLLDHFRPPLSATRHWESFHAGWATEIMRTLNREVLPEGYFAEAQVHVGSRVEIDGAAFERDASEKTPANGNSGAVAVETWAPPATSLVMPMVFPNEIEIQVFGTATGATLVAAIELVSPGNKDRIETRRAFVSKCLGYLQMGIGLVIVDIVTDRQANLHNELVAFLEQPPKFLFPADVSLYSAAFRPARRATEDQTELWLNPLSLGQPLPTMPLALRGGATLPLDLETTYSQVCRDSRL